MRARLGRVPSHASVGGSRSLTVGVITAAVIATLVSGCGGKSDKEPSSAGGVPAVGKLPQATTFATLKNIAKDADTTEAADTKVVHPKETLPISATPGGQPVAALPDKELGTDTWVPAVAEKPGWVQVLLPSKPNGSTGWIPSGDDKVQTAHSSYAVKVNLTARRLTLLKSGRSVGNWSVAVGAPKTPTPTGRTFMLAVLAPSKPTYSPLILPMGTHSATLDKFDGGSGTAAFHGWPSKSVFGKAVTHGCVRVPSDALQLLAKVPLGTLVSISA
jgi:lipoprotein-anchoring transpeptidase ErfK/SrfK